MTGTPPNSPLPPGNGADGPDEDAGWLSALLTDLADDPQAPPSTVSPLSVIAAARRGDHAGDPVVSDRPGGGAAEPAGTTGGVTDTGSVTELRARRRRSLLAGLVAAACLLGVGVVVIPLALNSTPSVTSSSTDANRLAETPAAAAAAPAQPEPDLAAPESEAALAQGSAAADGGAPEAGGEQGSPGFADSSPEADSGLADAGVVAGCWPPLDDAATAALRAALPAGAFGGPVPLVDACEPAAIAGAVLAGGVPYSGVVVRVTAAEPGACSTAVGCVSVDGGYVATDASGSPVGYVYGNGYQVAVGGSTEQASAGSGVSTAQLITAAQAVLAALS
jgi:hypothetical protein